MIESDDKTYTVFTRNWWKPAESPGWPGNREPDPTAEKTVLATGLSYAEARAMAREYNATHDPGELSYKAELHEGEL